MNAPRGPRQWRRERYRPAAALRLAGPPADERSAADHVAVHDEDSASRAEAALLDPVRCRSSIPPPLLLHLPLKHAGAPTCDLFLVVFAALPGNVGIVLLISFLTTTMDSGDAAGSQVRGLRPAGFHRGWRRHAQAAIGAAQMNVNRFVRFAQIGNRRRAMLAEAGACLLAARLTLIFVPFPRLARRLGTFVQPADPRASRGAADTWDDARLAVDIGWAVTRAARYLPFRSVCLPQAIAAQMMLSRRGVRSVMHFGARRGTDKPLDAHAWLDAAGVEVTGFPVTQGFVEIGCFVWKGPSV
jgi:Transglutaminase-like superfamily